MSTLTRRHASARSVTPTYEGSSIRIVEMPVLGAVTDSSYVVGERAGSGLFSAMALRSYINKTVSDFGAKGDGVTDDSAAFQAAINSGVCNIPYSAAGYLIRTPLNCINRDILIIRGVGAATPSFGFAYAYPRAGSVLLAGTGSGKPVLDCTGSCNLFFSDFSICAQGVSSPSTIGIIAGTSTRTGPAAPGGSGGNMTNISIVLTDVGVTIPFYGNNWNLASFVNCWTLGYYGIVICSSNPLSVTPPYGVFGPAINSDGITATGCNLLGYGGGAVLFLEGANNHVWLQTYVATIYGGAAYSGQPYSIYIKDSQDLLLKVEADYFPGLIYLDGSVQGLHISGTTYPRETPVPANIPTVAFLSSGVGTLNDCLFRVNVVHGVLPNNNFFYSSPGGATPVLTRVTNCQFHFNTGVSPNTAFWNFSGLEALPISNCYFNGNSDAAGIDVRVNNVAAALSKQRYYVNGKLIGSG
jgi:hypothetical protein